MILYYLNNEIYIDFKSILERVSVPESTLYRRIRNKCSSIRYRNRVLFDYKALVLEYPELVKQIEEYEHK
jgi:hypothetical protein